MLAAIYEGPMQVRLQTIPQPSVPDGWALIDVSYCGIYGTDTFIVGGTHPRARAPLVLGHEFSGTLLEVNYSGALEIEGKGFKVGDAVVVEPLISCGQCHACQTGNAHVCKNLRLYGIDAPGGMAEFVVAPIAKLHKVPDGVSLELAALAEPLAVAVHAVRRSSFKPGDVVAVLGAGPIGLLLALVLRASGARSVLVSEASQDRLDVARALGFMAVDAKIDPVQDILNHTGGEGTDLSFDAAGHPAVAEILTRVTRVRGQIMLVGSYKKPVPVDLQSIVFKEQNMNGTRVYAPEDFTIALEMIRAGAMPLARLITALPFSSLEEGFKLAFAGGRAIKVLFDIAGTRA